MLRIFSIISAIFVCSLSAQAAAPFSPSFHHVHAMTLEDNMSYYLSRGMGPRTLNFYAKDGVIKAAGLFDRQSPTDIRNVFGVDQREYTRRQSLAARDGYRPVEFSVIPVYGREVYYGTWKKHDGVPYVIWVHMTDQELDEEWQKLVVQQGFRLSRHSNYSLSGRSYHAALFVKDNQPFIFYRGMSRANFEERVQDLGAQGFTPVDVSVYENGAQVTFSAVWTRENPNAAVTIGVDTQGYQNAFNTYSAAGYSLRKIVGYNLGRRFVAVWGK